MFSGRNSYGSLMLWYTSVSQLTRIATKQSAANMQNTCISIMFSLYANSGVCCTWAHFICRYRTTFSMLSIFENRTKVQRYGLWKLKPIYHLLWCAPWLIIFNRAWSASKQPTQRICTEGLVGLWLHIISHSRSFFKVASIFCAFSCSWRFSESLGRTPWRRSKPIFWTLTKKTDCEYWTSQRFFSQLPRANGLKSDYFCRVHIIWCLSH